MRVDRRRPAGAVEFLFRQCGLQGATALVKRVPAVVDGWDRAAIATLVGKRELLYAGRAPAAAPATGISKMHEAEQRGLIEAALTATNKEDGARETKRLMTTPVPAAAATSR